MSGVYKVFNKTYQPIILIGGIRIPMRSFVVVNSLTKQIQNLLDKGLITIRKM